MKPKVKRLLVTMSYSYYFVTHNVDHFTRKCFKKWLGYSVTVGYMYQNRLSPVHLSTPVLIHTQFYFKCVNVHENILREFQYKYIGIKEINGNVGKQYKGN